MKDIVVVQITSSVKLKRRCYSSRNMQPGSTRHRGLHRRAPGNPGLVMKQLSGIQGRIL